MTKTIGSILVVLFLLAGLSLLGYARWTAHITAADRALADGRLEEALGAYKLAEARFDALPALRQVRPVQGGRRG